ncbi:MAG: hypothetical protein Q9209_001743 [Squamulea sp. 1 TL-2023]
MDSLRNALGYGTQSGQEPLSGQTGRGTANEPFDAGNVAGQSGAPASEATSINPAGTSQFDTGTDTKGNTTGQGAANDATDTSRHEIGDKSKTHTSETLAAGVSSDSNGPADAPADNQPLATTSAGNTSDSADKGTDETRGADEQVHSEQSHPTNDTNANAQDTFFANAGLSKDKPAQPPKIASEVADKDPFSSSGGASTSNTTNEASSQPAAPPSSDTTSGPAGGSGFENVGSSAPDKNYKTANTEPHPQSSEVLSSATPGAALDSKYGSETTGSGYNNSTAPATGASVHDNDTTENTTIGGYDSAPTTTTGASNTNKDTTSTGSAYGNTISTAAAAADDTDLSPKTQPTESAGGLAGVSHNTGSAPSAPNTGVSDSSLKQAENAGAMESPGQGQGEGTKKKMSEKIKEKLHMGRK